MAVDYYDAAARTAPSGAEATPRPVPAARLSGSRRAVLAIADMLAHTVRPWLTLGFAAAILIGGVHFFSASSVPGALRAILFMALVAAPASVTLYRLGRFRTGALLAGRPLTWRAGHSAGLAVLSAALGSGALLLTADNAGLAVTATIATLFATILMLSFSHLASLRSALAAAVPGCGFVLLSLAVRETGDAVAMAVPGVLLLALIVGAVRYRQIVTRMLEQNPRNETGHIAARRKRATNAYNPFRIRQARAAAAEPPRGPRLYRPSEL